MFEIYMRVESTEYRIELVCITKVQKKLSRTIEL